MAGTGNPVPSDQIADLKANAETLDQFVSSTGVSATTRTGKEIKTIHAIEQEADTLLATKESEFDSAIQSTGWFVVGNFADGFTYTAYNQVGRDSTGQLWSYNGSLPFTVSPGIVPSDPDYTNRGDAALRSALAGEGGAKLVTDGVIMKDTVAAMVSDADLTVGDIVHTRGRYAADDLSGHKYEIVSSTGGDPIDGLKYVQLSNGLFARTNNLVFNVKAPATATFGANDNKWLFADPKEYNAVNTGEFEDVGNHFHFYSAASDCRVEFETNAGPMQFYIEGAIGQQVWYGLQEGPYHSWSIGMLTSEDRSLRFCTGFGLENKNPPFQINQGGDVRVSNGLGGRLDISRGGGSAPYSLMRFKDELEVQQGFVGYNYNLSRLELGSGTNNDDRFIFDVSDGFITKDKDFLASLKLKHEGLTPDRQHGLLVEVGAGGSLDASYAAEFRTSSQVAKTRITHNGRVMGSEVTSLPTFTFINDTDTGMGHPADNNLGLYTLGVEHLRVGSAGTFYVGDAGFAAGGRANIAITNTGAAPTANHPNGGILYVEGGALKFRGGGGTVTTIAPA